MFCSVKIYKNIIFFVFFLIDKTRDQLLTFHIEYFTTITLNYVNFCKMKTIAYQSWNVLHDATHYYSLSLSNLLINLCVVYTQEACRGLQMWCQHGLL